MTWQRLRHRTDKYSDHAGCFDSREPVVAPFVHSKNRHWLGCERIQVNEPHAKTCELCLDRNLGMLHTRQLHWTIYEYDTSERLCSPFEECFSVFSCSCPRRAGDNLRFPRVPFIIPAQVYRATNPCWERNSTCPSRYILLLNHTQMDKKRQWGHQ